MFYIRILKEGRHQEMAIPSPVRGFVDEHEGKDEFW